MTTSKNTYTSGNNVKNVNQSMATNLNKTYSSSSNIVKNLNKQKMGASSNKIYSSSSNIVKNINKPKMNVETSAKTGGSKYTQKSSYKQVQTSSGKSGSGFTKGTGKGTSSSQTEIYLNNVKILIQWSAQAGSTDTYPVCFPVKKGQTVKTRNIAGQLYDLSFYGIA